MKSFKLHWDHIEWGPYPYDTWKTTGINGYQYYFYWKPNWFKHKETRYWGYEVIWHDGPHGTFGFWYFNLSWSTHWTHYDDR